MKAEYYTVPPLLNCKPTEILVVEDFIIGREGYGEVLFPGKIDLKDIDLDSTVHINKKNVVIYPDDTLKPPIGIGLNRPAIVTLHNVWSRCKQPCSSDKFQRCLIRATRNMGAEFLDYQQSSGSWKFLVPHFSKYGLNDSDEETDAAVINPKLQHPNQIPPRETLNGLNNQALQRGLLTLDGEETTPKSLFFSPLATYNEMDDESSMDLQPQLRLYDGLNQMNRGDLNPSHDSFLNMSMNNERLCGMKTTFFDDDFMEDEDEDPIPRTPQILIPLSQKRRTEEPVSLPPLNFPFRERAIDFPAIQSDNVESPIFRTPRRFTTAKLTSKSIVYQKSLLFNRHHLLLDSGCFKSLSFRVGWGPKLIQVHLRTLDCLPFEEVIPTTQQHDHIPFASAARPFPSTFSQNTVHCSKLQATSLSSSIFRSRENILQNLQVQLEQKSLRVEGDTPLFVPRQGTQLLNAHYSVSRDQQTQGDSLEVVHSIWNLCTALWAECAEDSDPNSYNYQMARKELFSRWLKDSTRFNLDEELRDNSSRSSYICSIFNQLTGNRIADACLKASEFKDLRLGLLLSQASSSSSNRNGVLKQLENWHQFQVDRLVDPTRLKILVLLAGKLVWRTQDGNIVNCCEDLDWKRALSLHLWFHSLCTASIQEAVTSFQEAFEGSGPHGQYASLPYPAYIQSDPERLMLASQSESPPLDMCYYLLKLYCDQTTSLGKLLVPLTYGVSQLDYSLSWMVYQVLQSLNYSHLPSYHTHLLHTSFACQLEADGLWEWAVFVLLHITEASRRKATVTELLMRHLTLDPDEQEKEKEDFLTEKLLLPSCWLYAAKAVLARSRGSYRDEAWCLLKSSQWSLCHQIVVEKIAPDCIIHDQFDYLKSYLVELSNPTSASTILDWSSAGEVYLDYIRVSEAVEQIMRGQVGAYQIEELNPQIISLSNRIFNLQCQGAKGRLCQSEMSKKTVTLLRALLMVRKALRTGSPTSSVTDSLSSLMPKLPMPEDYALQELRAMVRSYMLDANDTEQDTS